MRKRVTLHLCGQQSHYLYGVLCRTDRAFRLLERAVQNRRFAPQTYLELKAQFTDILNYYQQFLLSISRRIPTQASLITNTPAKTIKEIYDASTRIESKISTETGLEIVKLTQSTTIIFAVLALMISNCPELQQKIEGIFREFEQYQNYFEKALAILESKL